MPAGDHHHLVPRPDELQQAVEVNRRVRRDAACHGPSLARAAGMPPGHLRAGTREGPDRDAVRAFVGDAQASVTAYRSGGQLPVSFSRRAARASSEARVPSPAELDSVCAAELEDDEPPEE